MLGSAVFEKEIGLQQFKKTNKKTWQLLAEKFWKSKSTQLKVAMFEKTLS